jgi:hypothetical protein
MLLFGHMCILLFGADKKANNISTNDDCYLGAYNMMELKRSDVSNENAAKSIVLCFRNQTRASLNDRLSQKKVDATESINRKFQYISPRYCVYQQGSTQG